MKKILIVLIVVIAIGGYFGSSYQKQLDPLTFNRTTYEHIDTSRDNNVANHFFTPFGTAIDDADSFIQITDMSNPNLTASHRDNIRRQISTTMSLKPLVKGSHRYFGMFRGSHPIYGIDHDSSFVILFVGKGASKDEAFLRSHADSVLKQLDVLSFSLE